MEQGNNMTQFIKQVKHQIQPPISIEREEGDVINIEGVRYEADYFRTFGAPDTEILYAVQRLEDGCIKLTMINSAEEAIAFFEEVEKNA